jgi:predicted GNAT superfamily acetyltransferase
MSARDITTDPPVAREAEWAAQRAADAAGVSIRELASMEDLEAAVALFDGIWHPEPGTQPISAELMKALSKAGNYLAGAYDTHGGQLVGACVGFFGPPSHASLHSHIAGVSAAGLGRSVGFALKVHQRAWALRHDATEIAWTYDPLIRRNAYFNLVKLGARPAEYLPNFYGGMQDQINGGGETDRVLVTWDLRSARVAAACAGTITPASASAQIAAGARVALAASPDGYPAPSPDSPGSQAGTALAGTALADTALAGLAVAGTVLVAVPADIERLRVTDPGAASEWRAAVRDTLGGLMAAGGMVTGFDRAGWYVIATEEAEARRG